MNKQGALALYNAAKPGPGDHWEAVAHALAGALAGALMTGPKPKTHTPKRNIRQGPARLSGGGKLPEMRRQNCGHVFNSAGCAVCLVCLVERRKLPLDKSRKASPFWQKQPDGSLRLRCNAARMEDLL